MRDQSLDWPEAVNLVEDDIVIIDINYYYLCANNVFAKMAYISQEEGGGRKCYEAVHSRGPPFSSYLSLKILKTKRKRVKEGFDLSELERPSRGGGLG